MNRLLFLAASAFKAMVKQVENRTERFSFRLCATCLPLFQWNSRKIRTLLSLSCMSFLLAACATHPKGPPPPLPYHGLSSQRPYEVDGVWYYPLPSARGFVQEGLASWYGPGFNGRPTASGEPYNMWAFTAAHKTLPLGTLVKVTNLENGKSVIARITDRGPFVPGRIIDLSARCAQCLGCFRDGLAKVKVQAVQGATKQVVGNSTYWKPAPVPSFRYGKFAVQIGAFRNETNAYLLQDRMKGQYCRVMSAYVPDKPGLWYMVQVGSYRDLDVAKEQAEKYRADGFRGAFVIAVDRQ